MTVTCMIGGAGPADRAALDYACSLARRLSTELIGLCALPDPATALIYATSPYMIGVGGPAVDHLRESQEKLIEACADMFSEATAQAGLGDKASFKSETNMPARAAMAAAALSDATVFPHPAGGGEHALSEAFERTMMESALPVILAPAAMAETGRALIAWDGSPQAARSIRLHLPILKLMDEIIIAQNPEDMGQSKTQTASAQPAALADWLMAHGLSHEIVQFGGGVATGLMDAAKRHRCEMIVSGAYGSSRAGEMLFGGATRGLLKAEDSPALALAH
ncbi:MAG: universal stress protein [Hyphomonadaceae bacterium]|nr:universal stress protein [Hyphomonadaceae bacterium]